MMMSLATMVTWAAVKLAGWTHVAVYLMVSLTCGWWINAAIQLLTK